ncbi:hypothetical protein [Halorubrum aethiopicum]|uniref:hypothetical protein n=1 Tax=Halorubrum aethiopicum TaxID=1758255 RepID=UPI0008310359|nr:hypothetical protein [Halorubrum aethiopicum]
MTGDETVSACPKCDSSSVAMNNIGGLQSTNLDADKYRCADCYETFDEPVERERRGETFYRGDSIAAKLDAASPDDLVTDGGVDQVIGLRDAYDQLDHELVECSESLSVQTSTPALFEYADTPGETDAETIADRLADSSIAFLDVLAMNGDAWFEFHVSGTAHDDHHGGDCRVTITTAGVTVVRTHRNLSIESFKRVVEAVAGGVDAPLRFSGNEL